MKLLYEGNYRNGNFCGTSCETIFNLNSRFCFTILLLGSSDNEIDGTPETVSQHNYAIESRGALSVLPFVES